MTDAQADPSGSLTEEELTALDAHWRAANYLAAAQIYLMANPLLTEPLRPEHIKPRLLGHLAGAHLRVHAPEPAHPAARAGHDVRMGAGARRSPRCWRAPGWTAVTPSGIPT
ncbi:hypothetical protein P3G67_10035 [Streptomyces sp. RB6PN23]|uniref:Xylulose 5-phosphate/Fructose 6-phosphate phosphoketolase N-terminal domain-containing protein n=1 Tax=Streptomyces silvisoli TaxID=3034235 RepID=A0ABT5ZIE0_9ACTN|nr:hypothetical protein [Streptomyces silvisoli]MDF3289576.1 hypothetical protein [Streptomyces silvisoli]